MSEQSAEKDRCVCPTDLCLGVPGESDVCDACLVLDPGETCLHDPCADCGHVHTPDGCAGDPTQSDLWAGVLPAGCDCDTQ